MCRTRIKLVVLSMVAVLAGCGSDKDTPAARPTDAPQYPDKSAKPKFRTGVSVASGAAEPCRAADLTALLGPVGDGTALVYLTNSAGVACAISEGTTSVRFTGEGGSPLESAASSAWAGTLEPGAALQAKLAYDPDCSEPRWTTAEFTLPGFTEPVTVRGTTEVPVAQCGAVELKSIGL